MADIKIAYGASSSLVIPLASLASDTSYLSGAESTLVDNSTTLALDYLFAGTITTGASSTNANRDIRVYVGGMVNSTTWPDVLDGVNSTETLTNAGVRDAGLKLAAVIAPSTVASLGYWFGPLSVAALFGGVVPLKFVAFVTQGTGVNLSSTGADHNLWITPVYETVV